MLLHETPTALAEFQAHPHEHLARLRQTGEVELLTLNGHTEGVVLSAETYDRLAKAAEYQESLAMARLGFGQLDAGEGAQARAFFAKARRERGQA